MIHKQVSEKITKFCDQREVSHQFIMGKAFFDRENGEVVCLTTLNDVIDYLTQVFGGVILAAIPSIEPGVILVDTKGKGVFPKAIQIY